MAQPKPIPTPAVRPVPLGRAPTYADVEALPSHLRAEIVGGELYVLPRPRPRHALAATRLGSWLDRWFSDDDGVPGGWWILGEPELHLEAGGRPIDPDLGGWRRLRMREVPETAAITLAPDWVCEVLSPSTEAYDRGPKMDTYGRARVLHAWLVDPDAHALEAFQNDAGLWRPLGRWQGAARVRVAPFEAVELPLSRLWG